MNDRLKQDLTEAFARIISMLLASIRARGWRGLKDLPKIWQATMLIRGYGQALVGLMADFLAGKFAAPAPAPEPAPASWTDAPERQAASAQSPTPHCPAARPDPVARARRHVAERPAADAEPEHARAAKRVRYASARPRPRGRTAVWLRPPRRALDPFAAMRRPSGIFATGRSTCAHPKTARGRILSTSLRLRN